jgi:hypothetical protein
VKILWTGSQLFNNDTLTQPENENVNVPVDGTEQCPSCGAQLAPDQRYCLECGHRRGDPRLPFMDAVVFMDAVKKPQASEAPAAPSQQDKRPLMSANASLVAGVATLVLAIGVGVLIGRSGEGSGSNVAATTPQIIKVGGGDEETEETESTGAGSSKAEKGNAKAKKPARKKAEKKLQQTDSGATEATSEVFEPTNGVKLPNAETKVGGKCESGTAGCEGGEFTGNFFE